MPRVGSLAFVIISLLIGVMMISFLWIPFNTGVSQIQDQPGYGTGSSYAEDSTRYLDTIWALTPLVLFIGAVFKIMVVSREGVR